MVFLIVCAIVLFINQTALAQEGAIGGTSSMSYGEIPIGLKSWDTLAPRANVHGILDKRSFLKQLGIKPDLSSFATPRFYNSLPVSLDPKAIPLVMARTYKQVDNTPAGAWRGPNNPIAGRLPPPDVQLTKGTIGVTDNPVVRQFKKNYADLVASVAGIYEFQKDSVIPKGTAFLVGSDIVVTAKHVIRGLRPDSENGTDLQQPQPILRSNVYILFNVDLEKYNKIKMGFSNYSPDTDPDAILLSNTAIAQWHVAADVATIRLSKKSTRNKIPLASDVLTDGAEMVIVGVPASKDMHIYQDELYKDNYFVLGVPDANADRGPLPVIWLTSGPFIGYEDQFRRRLMVHVNALRGNSGSPVFRADDGKVVGVLVDADVGRQSPNKLDYNSAVSSTAVIDLVKQFGF